MPTETKAGELVILEFKRISCAKDQYVKLAKHIAEVQYVSIKSALQRTLGPHGWIVSRRSFITGARSLNEKDLQDNLAYVKVPQTGIDLPQRVYMREIRGYPLLPFINDLTELRESCSSITVECSNLPSVSTCYRDFDVFDCGHVRRQ
jgi:hypothetical protein